MNYQNGFTKIGDVLVCEDDQNAQQFRRREPLCTGPLRQIAQCEAQQSLHMPSRHSADRGVWCLVLRERCRELDVWKIGVGFNLCSIWDVFLRPRICCLLLLLIGGFFACKIKIWILNFKYFFEWWYIHRKNNCTKLQLITRCISKWCWIQSFEQNYVYFKVVMYIITH